MKSLSADQEQNIRELALSGKLIDAIKLYREVTDAGLIEAKEAVEAMMHGAPYETSSHHQPDAWDDAKLGKRIKQLLRKRNKIQAVRVYREAHRCGLKEAKGAVDAIEAQMRLYEGSDFSSAPGSNNDPFAEDARRTRVSLFFFLAIFLIGVMGLALYILNNGM